MKKRQPRREACPGLDPFRHMETHQDSAGQSAGSVSPILERRRTSWSYRHPKRDRRLLFLLEQSEPALFCGRKPLVRGRDADIVWVGWLSKGKLALARIKGNDSVKSTTIPVPSQADWRLVSNLNHSDNPDGTDAVLAGMLLGKVGPGYILSGFVLAGKAGPKWNPDFRLPAGEIKAARLIPLSSHCRMVVWAIQSGDSLVVDAMDWDDAKGFGPVIRLATLAAASTKFKSLDVAIIGPSLKWGAAFHTEAAPGKPGTISVVSHTVITAENRTAPGNLKTRTFASRPGPLRVILKFSADGNLWLLERDVDGSWLQGDEADAPIAVESPRGSRFEDLYFRNRTVPKLLWLNSETGFESKGAAVPIEDDSDGEPD